MIQSLNILMYIGFSYYKRGILRTYLARGGKTKNQEQNQQHTPHTHNKQQTTTTTKTNHNTQATTTTTKNNHNQQQTQPTTTTTTTSKPHHKPNQTTKVSDYNKYLSSTDMWNRVNLIKVVQV